MIFSVTADPSITQSFGGTDPPHAWRRSVSRPAANTLKSLPGSPEEMLR